MTTVTPDAVLAALKRVRGPDLEGNIVDLGLVGTPLVKDGRVTVMISVAPERAEELEPLRQAAAKVVSDMAGVTTATVVLTSERQAGAGRPAEHTRVTAARQSQGTASSRAVPAQPPRHSHAHPPPAARSTGVPGVTHIIAVASGKGGVGKSTTAVNLALALQANGLKAGVLDADVYGPSLPRLLGLSGRTQTGPDRKLRPMQGYGLKVMSIGFLVDEGVPVIWRGPMVTQALSQMLREVDWGTLDVLVVDMPPGTGDAQISMAQQTPLSGAVIVSTPQDLALIDARKGLAMFRQVDVPVLGIIENMSTFICPHCGQRSDIFGHGGARQEAVKLGVPFLGEVPLHMEIRQRSDAGEPVVVGLPKSDHARIYRDIARKVWDGLTAEARKPAPRIVIE